MKVLIIAIVAAAGYYYWTTHSSSGNILDRLSSSPVPAESIIDFYSNEPYKICKDPVFTNGVGSSEEKCISRINNFSKKCKERILKSYQENISDMKTAKKIGKRYLSCVLPG